ncbi:hypothetical protein B0H13DRAFT_2039064 [Mycena leptocephala]|nr:hypothetical protein B0H13DRAFT_2039064 [Mycena leptocephala]
MTMQISGISTTVALVTRDAKHLFVRVSVDDKKIKTKNFDKKAPLGPCDVPFDPPYSVEGALHVELVKRHVFSKDELLGEITFTIQDAEKILRERSVLELKDHLLSNGAAEFRLSFSMKPNAGRDVILAGGLVANDMKSVLERLGKSYTVFEGTFKVLSPGMGKLHPIAKAMCANIDKVNEILHAEDKYVQDIQTLVEDMVYLLDLITNVQQFATLDQLKRALQEVDHLMGDTANFIVQYNSRSLKCRCDVVPVSVTQTFR